MAKRGRKPKNIDKNYFVEEQEQAVIDYLNAETQVEKNLIYNEKLRPAFEKMIESIIRRYNLYLPDESFEDTFNDTLSFLLTKFDKFEYGKYKAYSYYGTICKNYLIGRKENYKKTLKRNPSYDLIEEDVINNIRYANKTDRNAIIAKETIQQLNKKIEKMVETPSDFGLREGEVKLGKALLNLFENWDYVLSTDGSNKLNKNAILYFLREQTGLDTKGVRDNLKKYKKEFLIVKDVVIN